MVVRKTILFFLICFVPTTLFAAYPWDSICVVDMGRGFGSGTMIGTNGDTALVLTAKHVVKRPGVSCNCIWGGQVAEGRVLAVHRTADLALVVCALPKSIRPVPVALASPTGGPYTLAGFPGGYGSRHLRYQQGGYLDHGYHYMKVTCLPEHGMSGGAVFDRYGRVVGSVWGYDDQKEMLGYCGAGESLFDLLEPYRR